MILPDLVEKAAQAFPNKDALVFHDEAISFASLNSTGNKVAARLRSLGIGHGDRVVILCENTLASVVFFWGILKSGAQTVDAPCLAGLDSIGAILKECQPKAIVISERQLRRFRESKSDVLPRFILTGDPIAPDRNGFVHHTLEEIVRTEAATNVTSPSRSCEVAMIVYTSGTTGDPKGVMLSHRNLLSNITAANSLMHLDSADSILVVVPLHFIHGRMQLLTHAMTGGTMVFSAGFHFPQLVVNEIAKYKVTGLSGVPFHFSSLLEVASFNSRHLPDLRYVLITGGAMSHAALQRLSAALPTVHIHLAYGQTEASPRVTYIGPNELATKPGSLGRALPGVHVDVVAENGSTVQAGETGEVVVSGPNVMCGYVSGDEVITGKIDEFGRLHTGDIGRLNEQGFLYLLDGSRMTVGQVIRVGPLHDRFH